MNRYKFNSIVFEAVPAVDYGNVVAFNRDEKIYEGSVENIPSSIENDITKLHMAPKDIISLRSFVRTPQFNAMIGR